ncbi:unnamed protein product [Calypogeia fissa]
MQGSVSSGQHWDVSSDEHWDVSSNEQWAAVGLCWLPGQRWQGYGGRAATLGYGFRARRTCLSGCLSTRFLEPWEVGAAMMESLVVRTVAVAE